MYHAVEREDTRLLTGQDGFPDLTCTDEFWLLINTLPDWAPIPSQIIQLGLLIKHLKPISDDVTIEISDGDIDSAPEAIVTTRSLNLILKIVSTRTDHLTSPEKKRVGRFCEATKLSKKNESKVTDSEIIRAAKNNPDPWSDSFSFKDKANNQRKGSVSSPFSDISTSLPGQETTTESQSQKSTKPQPKKHSCEYCGREYSSPAGLRGHQRKCLKKNTSNKSASEKSTGTKSKSTKKSKRSTERYQCDHCDKGFKKKKTMKYHQRKCGGSSDKKSTSRVTSSEWRPDEGINIRKNRGSERKTGRSPFSDPSLIKDTISKTASKKNKKKDKK